MKSLFRNKIKEKNDNVESAKMALVNTVANMISMIIGVVMIPIIASIISPEDIGIATTFLSTRNTLVIVAVLAVHAYMNKAMLEYAEDKKNYIFNIVMFAALCIAVLFIIAVPFKNSLMAIFSLDEFLFYWLFFSMFSYAVYVIASYYAIFHNKHILVFLMTISVGPVSQFLSVFLAFVLEKKYIGRVIGLDAVYSIVTVCLIIWLIFFVKKQIKPQYVIGTLKFTVPIIPHLLAQMVLTQCDLLMISFFCGEGKTGVYSMGHTIGFLAFTVMAQIMSAWSPWVFRRWECKQHEIVFRYTSKIMLLGTYISVGLLTVSPELIHIFLPIDYEPCVYIVPPLVVGMFFQFINLFIYDVEYYAKKSAYIAVASVIAAASNLVLNYLLIPPFGYLAAGYTTVFSYLLLVIFNYIFSIKLDISKRYNNKHMVACVLSVIAYASLTLFIIDYIVLRYVFLIIITSIILKLEYRDIKVIISDIRNV